jgi:ssDNA-binding replication factor A large subunit
MEKIQKKKIQNGSQTATRTKKKEEVAMQVKAQGQGRRCEELGSRSSYRIQEAIEHLETSSTGRPRRVDLMVDGPFRSLHSRSAYRARISL